MSWFSTAVSASAVELGRRHPHFFAFAHGLRRAWPLLAGLVCAGALAAGVWALRGTDLPAVSAPSIPGWAPWAAGAVLVVVLVGLVVRRWGSDAFWWLRYDLPAKLRGY